METKISQEQKIKALKVRMRSVMIEHRFDTEDFIDGDITTGLFLHLLEIQLQDLKDLIESL